MPPMIDRKIALTDRFYDVAAMSPDRALVIGYGGKILETLDGGFSWTRIPSGTDDRGLFRITFGDANHGWIVGQDGDPADSNERGEKRVSSLAHLGH